MKPSLSKVVSPKSSVLSPAKPQRQPLDLGRCLCVLHVCCPLTTTHSLQLLLTISLARHLSPHLPRLKEVSALTHFISLVLVICILCQISNGPCTLSSLQTRNTDTDSDMNWYRYSYRKNSLTDIPAKFRYEIRYELPSDLISEWFFTTITVHIGVISEMHTSKLDSKSEKQRKKPVGPNSFYMKRLSDTRPIWDLSDLISETLYCIHYCIFIFKAVLN
jgi:hypothetical protein